MISQSAYRPIAIRVRDLWVAKGGGLFSRPKALLQEVNFDVEPGTFVGVVGPNGAGKTTLLKAMVGESPARGQILFFKSDGSQQDFESLYDNPEYWLRQIGYVPVDNVLHEELTVQQALMHVGRLRLPNTPDEVIFEKIQVKLHELGFERDDERLDRMVRNLSSGERKKANIVAELLTDPPLLLLDEPTSNLDPNAERDLMDSLKKLAGSNNNGNGPTILLVTHTLASLDRCDQVIFIENSRLTQNDSPKAVFANLEKSLVDEGVALSESSNEFEHWAVIFDIYKTGDRANRNRALPPQQSYPRAAERPPNQDSFWRQFRILFSRYFLMRYNDPGGILFMLVAGFIAGFLLLIAPSDIFLEANDATAARQTVVLYVILVVIIGAFISHREVSKEFRIYIHERSKGLNPLAYLMAKAIWLSTVIGLLATAIILALTGMPLARLFVLAVGIIILLVAAYLAFRPGANIRISQAARLTRSGQIALIAVPLILAFLVQLQLKRIPDFPLDPTIVEIIVGITMVLTSIAALVIGLMVSSAVGTNNDRATQFVIGIIIINVILAFSVLVIGSPEFQGLFNFLKPFAATHWGYRGFSSGLSIYCWAGQPRLENYNSTGHIIMTWLLLGIHVMVAMALAVLALRLQETWISKGRVLRAIFLRERGTLTLAVALLCVVSWSMFLSQRSESYFELTFFDRLFGGTRYAYAENVEGATPMQLWVGSFSSSACGAPKPVTPSEDAFAPDDAVAHVALSLQPNLTVFNAELE